jgi:hypothetical protein
MKKASLWELELKRVPPGEEPEGDHEHVGEIFRIEEARRPT